MGEYMSSDLLLRTKNQWIVMTLRCWQSTNQVFIKCSEWPRVLGLGKLSGKELVHNSNVCPQTNICISSYNRKVVFPCFKCTKFDKTPVVIPVLEPKYENITLPLSYKWNQAPDSQHHYWIRNLRPLSSICHIKVFLQQVWKNTSWHDPGCTLLFMVT